MTRIAELTDFPLGTSHYSTRLHSTHSRHSTGLCLWYREGISGRFVSFGPLCGLSLCDVQAHSVDDYDYDDGLVFFLARLDTAPSWYEAVTP